MYRLGDLRYPEEYAGQLAVLDQTEDSTIYVIWKVQERKKTVMLVELDRPQDGNTQTLHLEHDDVYVLEPLEVVERVTTWKE